MIGGVRVYALRLTYAVSSAGMHCSLSSATNQVSHVLPVALGVMGGFEGTRWKQRSYRHRSATSPHRSVFELGNRVSGAAVAAGVMLLNRCTAYSSYLGYGHNGHRDAVDAYVAKVDVPFFSRASSAIQRDHSEASLLLQRSIVRRWECSILGGQPITHLQTQIADQWPIATLSNCRIHTCSLSAPIKCAHRDR